MGTERVLSFDTPGTIDYEALVQSQKEDSDEFGDDLEGRIQPIEFEPGRMNGYVHFRDYYFQEVLLPQMREKEEEFERFLKTLSNEYHRLLMNSSRSDDENALKAKDLLYEIEMLITMKAL